MKKFKKFLSYILLFLLLGIVAVLGLHEYIQYNTSSEIYQDINSLPASHTVIVLGASVHSDGKLSPILKDRVDTALELYRKGKAKQFLLSGDNREEDYDEVSAMKNYLLERNVPADIISTDPAGIDTYDSMYRSGLVYDVPSAVVVTQEFHLPRTLFIAKNLGYDYKGYAAHSVSYSTEQKLQSREKLANVKAVFELITDHTPSLKVSKGVPHSPTVKN